MRQERPSLESAGGHYILHATRRSRVRTTTERLARLPVHIDALSGVHLDRLLDYRLTDAHLDLAKLVRANPNRDCHGYLPCPAGGYLLRHEAP